MSSNQNSDGTFGNLGVAAKMKADGFEVHVTEGLAVRPGDTFVVKVPPEFDQETVQMLHDHLTQEMTDVKVIIIHGDIEIGKVDRDESRV